MDHERQLTQAMNIISLEDEEEGVLEIEDAASVTNNLQTQGFDAKLCIVGRFILEGRIDMGGSYQRDALILKQCRIRWQFWQFC